MESIPIMTYCHQNQTVSIYDFHVNMADKHEAKCRYMTAGWRSTNREQTSQCGAGQTSLIGACPGVLNGQFRPVVQLIETVSATLGSLSKTNFRLGMSPGRGWLTSAPMQLQLLLMSLALSFLQTKPTTCCNRRFNTYNRSVH